MHNHLHIDKLFIIIIWKGRAVELKREGGGGGGQLVRGGGGRCVFTSCPTLRFYRKPVHVNCVKLNTPTHMNIHVHTHTHTHAHAHTHTHTHTLSHTHTHTHTHTVNMTTIVEQCIKAVLFIKKRFSQERCVCGHEKIMSRNGKVIRIHCTWHST